jgi:putative colanic acid biosynthesis acetyltransferase WcaF
VWPLVHATLFRGSFHNWYRWRARLLRAFGATLGETVIIRRSVQIDQPWNVTLGRKASLGDGCVIWAHAPVSIGARTVCSQYTLLSTWETNDAKHVDHRPITLGDDVWIAAESYVAAGSEIGAGTVVGARSVTRGTLPPWTIAAGDPARPRRPRPYPGQDETRNDDG